MDGTGIKVDGTPGQAGQANPLAGAGGTSSGNQGTSEEPKLIPETEVEKLVSDRLAQVGRDAKSVEAQKSDIERREQALTDWQRQKDEDEQKAIKDNPELLDVFHQKKALRDREATFKKERLTFEKEKLEHQIEIEGARKMQLEIDVFDIAKEYEGGDAAKLKSVCETFDAKTKEQIRKVAGTFWPKATATGKDTTSQKGRDSGVTQGGTGEKTQEQSLDERYPTMKK